MFIFVLSVFSNIAPYNLCMFQYYVIVKFSDYCTHNISIVFSGI